MAQYDVYLNISNTTSEQFPYLLEVQSDLFEEATRVVILPMVPAKKLSNPDKTLNPAFDIENKPVLLFPLDIASINRASLGEKITNLHAQSDAIVTALDLLFTRC